MNDHPPQSGLQRRGAWVAGTVRVPRWCLVAAGLLILFLRAVALD